MGSAPKIDQAPQTVDPFDDEVRSSILASKRKQLANQGRLAYFLNTQKVSGGGTGSGLQTINGNEGKNPRLNPDLIPARAPNTRTP